VPKLLYDEAIEMLGETGVVELVGLLGYYSLVSMTLNTFEVGLPDGEVSDLVP
jgi:4-carboxymuconolactone decarboxylase